MASNKLPDWAEPAEAVEEPAKKLPDWAERADAPKANDLPAPSMWKHPLGPTPEARTPDFLETVADRVIRAAAPVPNSALDAVDASSRAMQKAGVRPSFSVNRMPPTMPQEWYDKNAPGVAPTKEQMSQVAELTPESGDEVKAERAAGGKESPWGAALGNMVGTGVQLYANPVSRIPMAGILKSMPAAQQALGTVMPKLLANTLVKGTAGTALAALGQAGTGHVPDKSALLGGAGMILPVATGLGSMAYGKMAEGLTPEERAGWELGGVGGALTGGMSEINELGPTLRKAADGQAIRAIGMRLKDLQRAGGVDKALGVGRRLLNEKLLGLFDNSEGITNKVMERKGQVGEEIASNLDQLGSQMTPEQKARLRPFVLAGKVDQDVLPALENTAARRPLLGAAQGIKDDIRALGDKTDQAPLSFSELNRQKTAYGDEAYKAANPFNPSPKASVLQDTYRSLNNHMENLGEEVSKGAGTPTFAQWLENKAKYGDLQKAYETGAASNNRQLANRAVSASDYLVGTGGGVSPRSMALGALNKLMRERGNSTAAVSLDKLAGLAERVPNPLRALRGGNAPRGGLPPPDETPIPPGSMPPSDAPPLPPAGPPEGIRLPAPPSYVPGNPLANKAERMVYRNLVDRLVSGKPFDTDSIINHETGEVLLPANGIDEPPYHTHARTGTDPLEGATMPPAVSPQTTGTLEPLTPRLELVRRLMGEAPPLETRQLRAPAFLKTRALLKKK